MKSKKIDLISKYFYLGAAGIETNILRTYSVLAEKGWNITVHCSTDTLSEKDKLPLSDTILGIKVKRYKFLWYSYFPKINWKTVQIVALHNFNIIPHFYILIYSLYLKIIGRKTFALVLTPHGGFNPEWSTFFPIVRYFKQFYHYVISTFLINTTVDAVRAVSEWENDQIISKGVNKNLVHIISNGVEDEAYLDVDSLASQEMKNKVKKLGCYLLQIGRIYRIKNYETTIKALPFIPKDINYVIAGQLQGNNNYLKSLKELAKKLKVEDRLIFIGVIKDVDKYYVIKHAAMMVHMALYESFCNVVHEGLSQGLICIVANNTALPYLIKNDVNGYCVETFDYKTVADKVNYVLENKDSAKLQEMSKRNRVMGLEMSWRKVAEKMDLLYINIYKKYDK